MPAVTQSQSLPQGYSIRVASRLTGISADTLRMWERRYGFPNPARNGSQVRVYMDADIERLVLVARALKAGFRAGEVVHRAAAELRELLVNSVRAQVSALADSPTVDGLLDAVARDDAPRVRSNLRSAVATLGPRQFLTEVAGPVIERVGEAWASGRLNVRHEHLLSEAMSTQIRLLLSAYDSETSGPVILLAAMSHEQHGLGLEMAALYLALAGATPRLLGVDTPADQIVEAASALGARIVGISVSRAADLDAVSERARWILGELPPAVEMWIGGRAAASLRVADPRCHVVVTWDDVDQALERVRAPQAQK